MSDFEDNDLRDRTPEKTKRSRNEDIGRTKATAITKNVIGKCYHEDLAGKLMKYKFSVIIDESTDVGTVKNMAIYVKYYNLENNKLETKFWELVQLFTDPESAKKGATADILYNTLLNSFIENEIPMDNIIGFAADGCNTMFGEHNSVSAKLKEQFPVDPKDETQYLSLNSIYLGASINITQNKNINEQMLVDVSRRCRFFLIELCIEIKLRFDFNDQVLSSLYYISPKHIFSQQHSNTRLNFIILFPRICNDTNKLQLIDDKWRKLNSYFDSEIINVHKNKNVDMFWLDLYLYEENGEKLFPNLAEFVLNVLSLPQLNCVCERLFSKVNLIKTKLRNKLMTKTINGLINTSECVKTTTCVKFEPTKKKYACLTNAMYDFPNDELNINEIVFDIMD
ncbi:hypothetical protein ACI65C_006279 [Semiaphis heraclei]